MPNQNRIVSPAFPYDHVRLEDGTKVKAPEGWELLPPGDAMLTRRVRAAGPHWIVQEKVGRKMMSKGTWAPKATIAEIRRAVEAEKASPAWAKKQEAAGKRREAKQEAYVEDFQGAVLKFLKFAPVHEEIANELATAVTKHATPVGSGTVARTERIPLEERAAAAVIAWMRHQTTGYDDMKIPLVKGLRREVRRDLAKRSDALLNRYRRGEAIPDSCPLRIALNKVQ